MSAENDDLSPKPAAPPPARAEDIAALSWLARWIGIPLAVVIALYYAEPLFRPRVEVVPTVTRQEVQPYPFPPNAVGPSLAPPEVPRTEPAPPPSMPPAATEEMSAAEVVARPISQPQPQYPRRALEAEKEGTVRLRITIAPDGSVSDAVVVNAVPRGWFESAAISAVKRWRYQPSPHTIQTEVEIEFKLK